jgi:hypothetical protein
MFADGCDVFGYLRLAQVLRDWHSGLELDYRISHTQTDQVTEFFRHSKLPEQEWSHFVAPHAHHYNSRSQAIGIQYPPGTGLLLAMFEPSRSIQGLSQFVAIVLALLGLWHLQVPWVLAAFSTIVLIDTVQHYSYSIQALTLFLVIGTLLLLRARQQDSKACLYASVAGVLLAFACLCRIPLVFHAPAWFFLLRSQQKWVFAVSFNIVFWSILLPYNAHLTGSPWIFTYSSIDKASPSFSALLRTIPYYFWGGGTQFLWAVILQGLLAWKFLKLDRRTKLSLFLLVAIPLIYFLTHDIYWSYYMHPTWMALVWIWAALMRWESSSNLKVSRLAQILTVVFCVAGAGVLAQTLFRGTKIRDVIRSTEISEAVQGLLKDDKAWILSDILSGSFWYYHKKPSLRAGFASEAAQDAFVQWTQMRQDRVYWVNDSDSQMSSMKRLEDKGYIFESIGFAFGAPVYRVTAP